MRRLRPDERRGYRDDTALPGELAAGPDPAVWTDRGPTASAAWRRAGETWSRGHGYGPTGWMELLDDDVRYATSALGRAHARHGGYVPPWDQAGQVDGRPRRPPAGPAR